MEQAVQTEVILERIFQCASFRKLKKLRLVCKYWNKLASTELRNRSRVIYLDSRYPEKWKKFYLQELSMRRNQEITAELPISANIGGDDRKAWNFLKDMATHEGWRTRVSFLKLTHVWASDLNRLLPFLLDQMPSVTVLRLQAINAETKSIIPKAFKIPEVSSTKRFSLTSLNVHFFPIDTSDTASGTLDSRFVRQCHSLKEVAAIVDLGSKEDIGFFELLNRLYSEEGDFLVSCDKIHLSVRSSPTYKDPLPLATLAQFANNIQPTFLHLDFTDPCRNSKLVSFLTQLRVELRVFNVHVPLSGNCLFFLNWLMKILKKFKIFSQLEELSLLSCIWVSDVAPEEFARDVNHNLDRVNTLKIGYIAPIMQPYSMDGENLKHLLEDASHHLRNVACLELLGFFYGVPQTPDVQGSGFNFKSIIEGIRHFSGLREILFDVHDFGGELDKIAIMGCKGLLEPLSLLAGSSVQTLTLNVELPFDWCLEVVLLAFFKGYEPKVQLNLNLKTTHGLKKYRYSKEELKETMDKIARDLLEATDTR